MLFLLPMSLGRCPQFDQPLVLRAFHDHEWGKPVTEAEILFEYLVLHTFQAGLPLACDGWQKAPLAVQLLFLTFAVAIAYCSTMPKLLCYEKILRPNYSATVCIGNCRWNAFTTPPRPGS